MMAARLTTVDNPYDPFTQFDEWYAYDESHGYCSCEYLDRILKTSHLFGQEDQEMLNEMAIDEIIKVNPIGIYKKVINNN